MSELETTTTPESSEPIPQEQPQPVLPAPMFGGPKEETPKYLTKCAPVLVGLAEQVIDLAGIDPNKDIAIHNLDPDHYVLWGPELNGAMVVMGKIRPWRAVTLQPAPTVTIRMIADTAPVLIQVEPMRD
jgi:hypothetical protein